MTPKELFAVGLRLLGVWFAVSALPAAFTLKYIEMLPGIVGLILITQADLIASLCYPKEVILKDDFRGNDPRD